MGFLGQMAQLSMFYLVTAQKKILNSVIFNEKNSEFFFKIIYMEEPSYLTSNLVKPITGNRDFFYKNLVSPLFGQLFIIYII